MMRGQKPQPPELKAAKGETRPSRLPVNVVDFPKAEAVPEPPAWLTNAHSQALWRELAGLLFTQKVLANVDTHALAHLCQLHGRLVKDYERDINPKAAELSQLRIYFAEFGMTPSSRTRVSKVGNGKDGNAFGKNGKKAREAQA